MIVHPFMERLHVTDNALALVIISADRRNSPAVFSRPRRLPLSIPLLIGGTLKPGDSECRVALFHRSTVPFISGVTRYRVVLAFHWSLFLFHLASAKLTPLSCFVAASRGANQQRVFSLLRSDQTGRSKPTYRRHSTLKHEMISHLN